MKFIKGVMIGTLVSAGAIWMFSEASNMDTKKIMKKGKKIYKKHNNVNQKNLKLKICFKFFLIN